MGERAASHIRRVGVRLLVRDLGDVVRHLAQPAERLLGHHAVAQLELEIRDQRHQVEVAAALAVAVDRPLHLHAARPHRGERVGHREPRVVVRMDAERHRQAPAQLQDPLGHDLGQLPAVGVAEDDRVGAGFLRRVERRERVPAVEPPAVEEVLRVVHHLPSEALEPRDALPDHPQVLLPRRLQHPIHVEGRGLADQGDDRRPGVHQRADVAVFLAPCARPSGAAEGRHLRARGRRLPHAAEELGVLGIGAGPAALDVVDAEAVEDAGDLHLVLQREGETLALGAVTEGGVVEPDGRGVRYGHGVPGKRKRPLGGRGRGSVPDRVVPLPASSRAASRGESEPDNGERGIGREDHEWIFMHRPGYRQATLTGRAICRYFSFNAEHRHHHPPLQGRRSHHPVGDPPRLFPQAPTPAPAAGGGEGAGRPSGARVPDARVPLGRGGRRQGPHPRRRAPGVPHGTGVHLPARPLAGGGGARRRWPGCPTTSSTSSASARRSA